MMYVSWEEWEKSVSELEGFPKEWQQAYQEQCPAFDPQTSRSMRQWSILTEYLRTWPGAVRSNHPTASVVAVGSQAEWITEDHPLCYGYGAGSPFEKLCKAGGQVLLLGSPLTSLTLLHHAEHMAKVPGKRVVHNRTPVLRDGQRVWIEFEQYDTCQGIRDRHHDEYFEVIVGEFLSAGKGNCGKVGAAESYLFDASELARFAIKWMERMWGE
jgi:aminoglycoside 3-N-acetyltransferase